MRLLIDNQATYFSNLSIIEDLSQYFMTVEFSIPFKLNSSQSIVLEDTKKVSLHVTQFYWANDVYTYICISSTVYSVLNKSCHPFSGLTNISSLCSKLGFTVDIYSCGNQSYWNFPQCKLTTAIDLLNSYASFPMGGGSRFYLDVDGVLRCVDFKFVFQANSVDLSASVISDRCLNDWFIATPGTINLYSYSATSIKTERFVIKEGFGVGNAFVNDTDSLSLSMLKHKLINEFWYNYYTSRQLEVQVLEAPSCNIGDLVNLNKNLVCTVVGRTIRVSESDDSSPQIFLKLATYE